MKTEEEKLKKKLKLNSVTIVILLIILLVILTIVIVKIFSVKDGMNNNDYNKGLIKKDKDKEKVLSEDQAYSINYFDGFVYYTTPNSKGGINIKRINTDGKKEKIILSTTSSSTKMYLQDSKIYYLTSNPDRF